ncbi:MAG: hypothetical protein ABR501_15390, partial [Pyrinomonadaceae bacterium]
MSRFETVIQFVRPLLALASIKTPYFERVCASPQICINRSDHELFRLSEYFPNRATPKIPDAELWARAIEKVKEDRGASTAAIEIPTQLRHYEDRKWFLATQVAEVEKFRVQSSQDFVDLAALLARGELIPLPAVTENYLLFGVGARADDKPLSRFVDDHNIALYNE